MKLFNRKPKLNLWALCAAILIPLLIGVFSAFLTANDMNIYDAVNTPPLSPPRWLFPIAWTLLYLMMGTASYLVWATDVKREQKRNALTFYGIQLLMNFFWSTLFFTYSQYLIAFIWLMAMWVIIIITMIKFYKIQPLSGILMGVLMLWTTFAAYLNLAWYILSLTPMALN